MTLLISARQQRHSASGSVVGESTTSSVRFHQVNQSFVIVQPQRFMTKVTKGKSRRRTSKSRAAINSRLAADHDQLVRFARQNTTRLIGRDAL